MNEGFTLKPGDRFRFENDTGSLRQVVCRGDTSGVTLTVLLPAGGFVQLEGINEPFSISCMAAAAANDHPDIPPEARH